MGNSIKSLAIIKKASIYLSLARQMQCNGILQQTCARVNGKAWLKSKLQIRRGQV
jgi:hypothetical protein